MNKNPYLYNPVAKMMLESYNQKIFEANIPGLNALSSTLAAMTFDAWFSFAFKLQKAYKRTPEAIKGSLAILDKAKNVTEVISKMDADEINADVRDTYAGDENAEGAFRRSLDAMLDLLSEFIKADPSQDETIMAQIRKECVSRASEADSIAKQTRDEAEKEEMEKKKKEAEKKNEQNSSVEVSSTDKPLNEFLSFLTGYRGDVKELRRKLNDMILSSVGKSKTSGYTQDWPAVFAVLNDRLITLNNTADGAGKKDRAALDELTKAFEKSTADFNSDIIKVTQSAYTKLVNSSGIEDPKLEQALADFGVKFENATKLKQQADDKLKANDQTIKEIKQEKQAEIIKSVFPIKKGDSDKDPKFKDSGIILAIQKALCGIAPAEKLLKAHNGPNGNYGPATTAVVSAIQKNQYGNKAVTGQVDHAFLLDLVSPKTTFVTSDAREEIKKACDILGETLK
jgi:exonuclease VII small subunit